MNNTVTRSCFCCDKQLFASPQFQRDGDEPSSAMPFSEPPDGAVVWHTRGNWGSVTIDSSPYEPSYEIAICDECINRKRGSIIAYEQVIQQHHTRVLGTLLRNTKTHERERMDLSE